MKPGIFFGSSKYNITLLDDFADLFGNEIECVTCNDAYNGQRTNFEVIKTMILSMDFVIFIAANEDVVKRMNGVHYSAIDQIFFEFGICLGVKEFSRCFLFIQDERFTLSTSFKGVNVFRFKSCSSFEIQKMKSVEIRNIISKMPL